MPASFVQTYRAFAYNNAWANYRLLAACTNLTQEDFEGERTGFFPSLQMTLNHIYVVDLFYVDALEGGCSGQQCGRTPPPISVASRTKAGASCDRQTPNRSLQYADA
jgi:uncharacterized damage-inducible protein DinB